MGDRQLPPMIEALYRRSPAAIVVVTFPQRPGLMDPADTADVVMVLKELAHDVASGKLDATGSIIVPYQRRTEMKVSIDLAGPNGKMWELDMKYHNLPAPYVMEIAAVAQSYAFYIENLPGNAGSQTPAYSVMFKCEAEGEELTGLSGEALAVAKGRPVRKQNLLYSQAIEVQDAGILLLQQLQAGAHREIKSGQRK